MTVPFTTTSTREVLDLLALYESRNVTFQSASGDWPIVWERALGEKVWDAEGNEYVDFTAAFGVAALGHARPEVVQAGQAQMAKLLHAMGDVHPHRGKALLCRKLSDLTFKRWTYGASEHHAKTIFCNSGFEAVEAALKTATLLTGKTGVIAFQKGYHGLGYGALNVTSRHHFRAPFKSQLKEFGFFVPFPTSENSSFVLNEIRALLHQKVIGAILAEPIQARGGINIPPQGFLLELRKLADEFQVALIFDEIYTGFGRTGDWFACDSDRAIPDIICLGKAMTGGFPLSACVGRSDIMDKAWPVSNGEAIHTSTFLGHPVGCAMALANIEIMEREPIFKQSEKRGEQLEQIIASWNWAENYRGQFRRKGLMAGLEIRHGASTCASLAIEVIQSMLSCGFILLPEGDEGEVISFTPPLTISMQAVDSMCSSLKTILQQKGVLR
ncbi:MAG: Aminotransferase class-III [Verrucomicrobiales bacterium]|nr:Aminotransferase class-III [Verrucomicrobiales bacterium]